MKNSICFIVCLIIPVFSFYIGMKFNDKEKEVKTNIECIIDTIIKHDTITQYVPKYVTKKTTDTIYLPSKDKSEVALEIEQFHFSKEGAYDAWISGYKPQLDSIKTYPRVEYKTITNNITKEIYKSTIDLYPYIGFKQLDDKVGQVIGLSVKMPKKWIYSAEIGVMDNKMMYGVTVGYKMN